MTASQTPIVLFHRSLNYRWLPILLIAIAGLCFAESQPPIELNADEAELTSAGLHVFTGNVVLKQGALSISADQIIVGSRNGVLFKLSGTGTPLLIENLTINGKRIQVEALAFSYQTAQWTLVLTGNVKLTQEFFEMSGHRAVYHVRDRQFTFSRDKSDPVTINFPAPLINQ